MLHFHQATTLLPPRIQYVVVHELAHLHEHHHTPEFWRRVGQKKPDFEQRTEWLARYGDHDLEHCSGSHLRSRALRSPAQLLLWAVEHAYRREYPWW